MNPAQEPESLNPHRTPAAGAIIKKMHELNPELGTRQLIDIVRQSLKQNGGVHSDFAQIEVIDEEKALSLVRATLR
jgi:hypothetical protein